MKKKNLLFETARMVILLFLVSFLAFVLVTQSPIDPLTSYIGTNSTLSEEARTEIAAHWNLDGSFGERFFTWLGNLFQGDMGVSITYKKNVVDVIAERFSYSIVLMAIAWVLSGVVGFFLGILCGRHKGSVFDKIIKNLCLAIKSTPTFWLGMLLLFVFAVQLGWFPTGMAAPIGKLASEVTVWDRIYHLILPVITLTIASMGEILLYTRQKVIEADGSDYILYAYTRGESKSQITFRHVLKNVILPAITLQFASFSELFGGMALAENVFAYPGIGTATTAAALNGDVPLLLGITLVSALFVFVGNLIANILYNLLDPRIRGGARYEK